MFPRISIMSCFDNVDKNTESKDNNSGKDQNKDSYNITKNPENKNQL